MPTILIVDGFRFYFYSNEQDEPAHVHVEKAGGNGKIWLKPGLKVVFLVGFSPREVKQIMVIIHHHEEELIKKWNEYFAK